MQIGFVGLGRMGSNMARRLAEGGHEVFGFDPAAASVAGDITRASSVEDLVGSLVAPRAVWVMVPAGEATAQTVATLAELLSDGDLVVDGGNSLYKDSVARASMLAERGIDFVDCGTSGGIWGYTDGFCLMAGGTAPAFERIEPALKTLAPPDGYAHVGPSGAGHYAKMIHNGIEYGMLQAYGEGFDILASSDYTFDLPQIAALWRRGSVVRSWLLDLLSDALERDPHLDGVRGYVADSGEGRWTIAEAIERDVPAPVITLSLLQRFASRRDESFSDKVIAALRQEFGGHKEPS